MSFCRWKPAHAVSALLCIVFSVETKSKASPFYTGEPELRGSATRSRPSSLRGGISVLILFSTILKPRLDPPCSRLSKSALKDKEAK